MKKITAILLVVALVAVAIAGSTMAYFTDEAGAVNVATVGNVKIAQHEYQRADGVTHNAGEAGKGNGIKKGDLIPYIQGRPLFPAVPANNLPTDYTAEATDLFFWGDYVYSGTAGNGLWNDDKLANVHDKMVFVENTGKSDLYFRTIIAFECPEGMEYSEGADKEFMMNINGSSRYDWEEIGYTVIDGVRYLLEVATYLTPLEPGNTAHPSLLQVVMTHNATNEDAALLGDTYEILVFSQAVQTAGFADAEIALNTAFGEIKTDAHPWAELNHADPDSKESLKDALQSDDKIIVVNLTEDATYDVAAWANEAMGGNKTEMIVINGNGHTLTFNQTNSDWNNIVSNGAKLVINNAHITSSGYNDGPWNRHDLNFACEVELNNVTSDKALAFKSGATLNHVVINDANTSDTYAIWIQPNGQTVTLNNVLIDMMDCTDGRGIKIDEQYVGADAKHVTLNVSNTTFKTEEKSAILVKSIAGATINLDNVDIRGVKGDPLNAVWIDEDGAAYADLVTVTGGTKVVEGTVDTAVSVSNPTELKDAVKTKNETVVLTGGTYDMGGNFSLAEGVTLIGGEDVVIKGTINSTLNNVTVKDVTIEAGNAQRWAYAEGTVVFENCTFDASSVYAIHFDGTSGADITYKNCDIIGWVAITGGHNSLTFDGCSISGNGAYGVIRVYGDTTIKNCTFDVDNVNTSDAFQDGIHAVDCTVTVENCTNVNGPVEDLFNVSGTGVINIQ